VRPYPLLFDPLLMPRVWGGRRLAGFGKPLPPGEPIGESWEIADIPEGRSRIANGALAGVLLSEAIASHRSMMMGCAGLSPQGGFPLLIKLLDSRENLSVQVHPTPAYVAAHADTAVKSEAWIVLEADPGAVIYKGVRPDVTSEKFRADINAACAVEDLVRVPVAPGDCHYLPSGTCHALGRGVLVAEVQTPSDTTFRVYDWGRDDPARPLHMAQAFACIRFGDDADEDTLPPDPIVVDGIRTSTLLDTECFRIERVEAETAGVLPIVTDDMPVIWMVTAGTGRMRAGGVEVALTPGTTVLIPAATRDGVVELDGGCSLLDVELPPVTRGMLAGS